MLLRLVASYLPVNITTAAASFGTVAVFTRLLDPAAYGRYALALAAVTAAQALFLFWIPAAISRFYVHHEQSGAGVSVLLATSYAAVAAVVAGLAFAVGVAALELPAPWPYLCAASMLLLAGRGWLQVGLEARRAVGRIRAFSVLEGGSAVAGLACGVLLAAVLPVPEAAPLAGLGLACLAFAAVDMQILLARVGRSPPAKTELAAMARYGLPLAATTVLGIMLDISDRFLLAWLADEATVGVYSVGYALGDRPMTMVFMAVATASAPLLIGTLEREGVEAARLVAAGNAELLLAVSLPATAGLALIAQPLAGVLAGPEFREPAAAIVPWIALAGLLKGWAGHYFAHAFLVARRTEVLAWTTLGPAALNIALNIVLIPYYGLFGAVFATVAAFALGIGLRIWLARRFFPLPFPLAACARAACATAVMVGVVGMLPDYGDMADLLLRLAAGIVAYAAAGYAVNLCGLQKSVTARFSRRRRAAREGGAC